MIFCNFFLSFDINYYMICVTNILYETCIDCFLSNLFVFVLFYQISTKKYSNSATEMLGMFNLFNIYSSLLSTIIHCQIRCVHNIQVIWTYVTHMMSSIVGLLYLIVLHSNVLAKSQFNLS